MSIACHQVLVVQRISGGYVERSVQLWQCLATGLIWNKGMLRTGTVFENVVQVPSMRHTRAHMALGTAVLTRMMIMIMKL